MQRSSAILIDRRYRERRSGTAACAHTTILGEDCRAIASRRCSACGTITCGVHVQRLERRAACPTCGELSLLFRRRGPERRA